MNVQFDIRGNLHAYPFIELSPFEFEQFFVKPFRIGSQRHLLFAEYIRYTTNLRQLLGHSFYQWIDGSFVSNVHSPNDIDVVSFINHQDYYTHFHNIK